MKTVMQWKKNYLRFGAVSIIILTVFSLLIGCQQKEEPIEAEVTYETFEETVANQPTTTIDENGKEQPVQLDFWYFDEASAPYYEAAAADFHERYGIEVICTYIDEVNYLEAINEADIQGNGPDVFVAANDTVRKSHLAGLIQENKLYTEEFWKKHYPEVARNALTSDGKQYGYPIYLDTSMMIYDTAVTTQPESFSSITDFAVNFVDETNTKVIFHWNIADPFYDYLFLGTGAQIMGDTGEDTTVFNVNNESVVDNMTYYQSLHEYFSMDVDTSTYEQVKSELADGTLVYGIVKTDVLKELSTYGSSYALCPVPPLSGDLSVQNLSVTYGAFVSDYTKQSEFANLFAAYLSYEYAANQFGLSQHVSARSDLERTDTNDTVIYQQYCQTIPVPKALENGDFWIYTEICFKNIWNGNDVTTELNQLQENMQERLQ